MSNCQLCDTCLFGAELPRQGIFYEIHITVANKISFEDDCYAMGIKPVIIDMGENISPHAMTATTLKYLSENDASAISSANYLAEAFKLKGYDVNRIKIETVPWHSRASKPSPTQYFEAHFPLKTPFDEKILSTVSDYYGLHRSKNLLKKGDQNIQMLTYRNGYVNNIVFERQVKNLSQHFEKIGLSLAKKTIVEFALYDTNVEMDNQWLKK